MRTDVPQIDAVPMTRPSGAHLSRAHRGDPWQGFALVYVSAATRRFANWNRNRLPCLASNSVLHWLSYSWSSSMESESVIAKRDSALGIRGECGITFSGGPVVPVWCQRAPRGSGRAGTRGFAPAARRGVLLSAGRLDPVEPHTGTTARDALGQDAPTFSTFPRPVGRTTTSAAIPLGPE
jgi:hypothetical protein